MAHSTRGVGRIRPVNAKTAFMHMLKMSDITPGPGWDDVPDLVLYDEADAGWQPSDGNEDYDTQMAKVIEFNQAVFRAMATNDPPARTGRRAG